MSSASPPLHHVGGKENRAAHIDPITISSISLKKSNATKFDTRNMQEQARRGSWRSLLESVKEIRKISPVFTPEERLIYSTYHILALAKLGNFVGAYEELSVLGDLHRREYFYEEHPDIYPGISGSMVPFALRWLHAAIPYRLGQASTSMERMYELLDYCGKREQEIASDSTDESAQSKEVDELLSSLRLDVDHTEQEKPVAVQRWRRRYEIVSFSIINLHLGQKDYMVALRFLDRMLARNPENIRLWSKLAHVQLQLGDIDGTKLTFAKVESLADEKLKSGGEESGPLACLIGRNRGLQAFVEKRYSAAVKEFNTVLEMDPGDVVAANNKALCLMYSRDLVRATQVIEDVLEKHTVSVLDEILVLNLCSMYELAAVNSNESKRKMSSWILQAAPDDFDLTCTRL